MASKLLLVGLAIVGAFRPPVPQPRPRPTEPMLMDIVDASFSEYDRTSKARCNGKPTNTQTCWQDSEGMYFKYGCRTEDTRIFTDSCGTEGCDDCDGMWKWAGETQSVCYDDGEHLYHYHCDDPTEPDDFGGLAEPTEKPNLQKSCADLGWPLQPGDLTVCGASQVNNGMCSGEVGWAAAERMCIKSGGRLCSVAELLNDETKGTGCKADCHPIWSSDECRLPNGKTGHFTAAGSRKCMNVAPETCAPPKSNAHARCCSDVLSNGAQTTTTFALPQGFSTAVAHDYRASDGNCDGEPISRYFCWVNPKDKKSHRFACSDDKDFVYTQSCGTDPDCQPKNCKGDWATRGDMVNKCYSGGDGVLYHYTCPGKKN